MKLDEPVVVSDVQGEVPVCTNLAALAAGEELVLFRGTPATAKAKDKSKKEKSRTWMQEKDAVECARAVKKTKLGS